MFVPSIREIIDYSIINFYKNHARLVKSMNYHNVYYYTEKLCDLKTIIKLRCNSGFIRRFSINNNIYDYKKNLIPTLKYLGNDKNLHTYQLGNNILNINFNKDINKIKNKQDSTFITLNDNKYNKYYIIFNNILVGVINKYDVKNPKLPGLIYGDYISEYSRCIKLLQNKNLIINDLSILGYRTLFMS